MYPVYGTPKLTSFTVKTGSSLSLDFYKFELGNTQKIESTRTNQSGFQYLRISYQSMFTPTIISSQSCAKQKKIK